MVVHQPDRTAVQAAAIKAALHAADQATTPRLARRVAVSSASHIRHRRTVPKLLGTFKSRLLKTASCALSPSVASKRSAAT